MTKIKNTKFLLILLISVGLFSCQTEKKNKGPVVVAKPIYEMKFKENMKEHPEDFFVMDGTFTITKLGKNYALHLRPRPLNTYGCLFGPELKDSLVVSADVFAGKLGRSTPAFGIGTNGLAGFRLYVRGARNGTLIQIVYNETQVVASEVYPDWVTDSWTSMKLYLKRTGKQVEVYGKAWPQGKPEGDWQVSYKGELELDEGQCSFWGIPYSGRDIYFDNLKIEKP